MSDYKRLTKKGANGKLDDCPSKVIFGKEYYLLDKDTCGFVIDCLNRLAELEDKIENGTLIKLPCKVGDTVYTVKYSHYYNHWFIDRHEVDEIIIDKNDIYLKDYFGIYLFEPFLTEAEAEADLAKKRGSNDNNN